MAPVEFCTYIFYKYILLVDWLINNNYNWSELLVDWLINNNYNWSESLANMSYQKQYILKAKTRIVYTDTVKISLISTHSFQYFCDDTITIIENTESVHTTCDGCDCKF